jgi:lipopolysaccharide biosynthesis glycosyltransferase
MAKIPIVLSTDENYAPYCATTIASVLKSSKEDSDLSFYILTAKLSEKTKEKFQELKKIKDCSIDFIDVDKDAFKNCPTPHHFTPEAYFRFKLPSLFPDTNKILYLDCDMIILTDLSDLFKVDIEGNYAAMALDASTKLNPEVNQKRLNLSSNSLYFNTGLVIFNLKKWREEDIEKKLFKWTRENKEKILWVDQDVMNVVFSGSIKELPEKYNVQLNFYEDEKSLVRLKEKMSVLHYCGTKKPWNDVDMFLSEYFWQHAEKNPFYEEIRENCLMSYSEMQVSELDFIKQLVRKDNPQKILEIGVAAGSCSTAILNEISDREEATVFGIDYSREYYRNSEKETGWIIGRFFPELQSKMKLFTGGVSACFLDEIGKDIDFCIIDTRHVIPGELLDFLMVLPYLKENSVCVLHDTNLQNLPVENGTIRVSKDADVNNLQYLGDAFATGVLMNVLATEKIFPDEYLKDFALPNIAAFRITPDLKKYIQNVFYALTLPWKYEISKEDEKIIADFFEKHYSKQDAEYFRQVSKMMHKKMEIENRRNREKIRELKNLRKDLKLAEEKIIITEGSLDSKKTELEAVYSSREWRAFSALRKSFKAVFPNGSQRRKILVAFVRFVKGPIQTIEKAKDKFFFSGSGDFSAVSPQLKKHRDININSRKIAYIGHSYHKKTKSTEFLIDYLKEFFEVEVTLDESWQGKPFSDLSFIDESYLGVIFFQVLPPKEIYEKIRNENIIHFPMYDQSGGLQFDFWNGYPGLKIVNFSKTLHEKLKKWKFESMYVQYFPDLKEFMPGNSNEVFFWQRLTKFNINTIANLFDDGNFKIHIHRGIDPEQKYIQPSQEDEKKFNITYTDWFETREEMLQKTGGLIKQKGIYVAPRELEGIGMSFLEAMAMGKAVVAADNPTMNEYIKHGENGYLFDLQNPKSIDFSEIEKVQKNAYEFMREGRRKWEEDKQKIIEFIKKADSDIFPQEKTPLINIITVAYNAKDDLEKTIRSVICQDYPRINYIVIDGGSKDGTKEMVAKYKDKIDIFISEKDSGIYEAMNKGISKVKEGYLNFLNAGDCFISPRVISDTFRDIGDAYDIVYGKIIPGRITAEKKRHSQENLDFTKKNLLRHNSATLCHQAMFTKKEIVPLYDTSYKIKGDLDWYFEIVERNPDLSYYRSDVVVANYIGGGMSEKRYLLDTYELAKLVTKRFGLVSFIRYKYPINILRRIFREFLKSDK